MQLVPCIHVVILVILIVKYQTCLAIFQYVFFAANIFGIGDCTNVPTSRTAAACAAESAVIRKNLLAVMRGEVPKAHVSVWMIYGVHFSQFNYELSTYNVGITYIYENYLQGFPEVVKSCSHFPNIYLTDQC